MYLIVNKDPSPLTLEACALLHRLTLALTFNTGACFSIMTYIYYSCKEYKEFSFQTK